MKTLFEIFKTHKNLITVMSQLKNGDLREEGSAELTRKNRERFAWEKDINPKLIVAADLAHGKKVAIVSSEDGGSVIAETDGLLTHEQNVFLSVTAADCLPVFFYDPKKEVAGIAHAGWRGLAKGVLLNMIQVMQTTFGSIAGNILVGIGPGIGECH